MVAVELSVKNPKTWMEILRKPSRTLSGSPFWEVIDNLLLMLELLGESDRESQCSKFEMALERSFIKTW